MRSSCAHCGHRSRATVLRPSGRLDSLQPVWRAVRSTASAPASRSAAQTAVDTPASPQPTFTEVQHTAGWDGNTPQLMGRMGDAFS